MLDLSVVESRWWDQGNVSVRGLFDLIATIRKDTAEAYHYEMFNNGDALQEIVPRLARKAQVRNLVIAAHGDERGIWGAEAEDNPDNRVSRAVLRNTLRRIPRNGLDGLYLGSCWTGNEETAEFLLDESRVRWVAGYSESIDFLESSALDLYFWTTYYRTNKAGGPSRRIRRAADRLGPVAALCQELGFNIFIRARGPGGGVQALLDV